LKTFAFAGSYPLLGLALALQVALGAGARAAERQDGKIRFDDTSFNFGDVYRGAQLSHRFEFTNVGTGPLTIQGVHAACGCTAVEVEQGKLYAPGEKGHVEVRFDTSAFEGRVVKAITVMSNERHVPDRTLTLKAFIKSEVEADPPLVDFGDSVSGEGATQLVKIKPLGKKPVRVSDVVYNKDILTVTATESKGEWILKVDLKPDLPPGFLKETIVVKNSSEHLAEMPIPVRANVKGNIEYSPVYLEFGAIAPEKAERRTLTLRGLSSFDVVSNKAELLVNGRKIEDGSALITIETLPHETRKKLVTVELKNAAKTAGSVHGKLILETTDPKQKEVSVDFYALFR
jgi:hypothetical protein